MRTRFHTNHTVLLSRYLRLWRVFNTITRSKIASGTNRSVVKKDAVIQSYETPIDAQQPGETRA